MDGERFDLVARGRVVKDHDRAKLSVLEALRKARNAS
jgi:hypothetical protein